MIDVEKFKDVSVETFLDMVGSDAPAPGGGGVAALMAASSAALIEMVANLTVHKKGYEQIQAEAQAIGVAAHAIRKSAVEGIAADGKAFQQVLQQLRLPKEKTERDALVQLAFREAACVPLYLGKQMIELLRLADKIMLIGNTWAVTDAMIGAIQARAAMRAAFYSVQINLKFIRDEAFVYSIREQLATAEVQAEQLEKKIEQRYQEQG
ncbi:methenyltetrahydrofolate cyclohydrolase [Megasphaera hutchinsoni]|jgi:hypothetical protein|uniref:Methenyltetrahydrofolate cyclohydrolase n=1 Tax=Megasphaera hutchinsoni TaxID=1588748 RepID=A0A2J8BAE4_9FIRM|nr:cyclodeaminase/cyclohydrolase family protein [Megasphaera genomosp. type_2]PNH21721.1 methenyltetrahydrofolate cyclohydrolase [Megasphaera genomosp. type_2]